MSTHSPSDQSSPELSPAIVGREREQAMLSGCLAAARQGRGRLVLVSGDAGIGKTTLVDWLAVEARQAGCTVLYGHCYDLTLTPPYGPWLDALTDLSTNDATAGTPHPLELSGTEQSVTSQSVLFEQVRAFLASSAVTQPVVLVLEDLHWSDPASLELLRHLGRSIGQFGLLLIATYRAEEITRQHPLFQALPLLVREANAERIDLQPFDVDDMLALVKRRYDLPQHDEAQLVDYLLTRTEGNPFYVFEVLRTMEVERLLQHRQDRWHVGDLDRSPVPPLVRQIIEGRLATIDSDTLDVLEVAAVIGQEVPLDLWRLASGVDDDCLDKVMQQATSGRLLVEAPVATSVRFTHALVRETLYQRQVLTRRTSTHARVAGILAERPDPPISLVASHFAQADDPRAIDWLVRAGESAIEVYAAHDAISALSRAQELAGRLGHDLPTKGYRARASAFAMMGEFENARHDYETALERGRATDDQRAIWQGLLDLGMLWAERDFERTGEHYHAALDLARTNNDDSMIATSLNRVANWHVNQDNPDAAIPLHREALVLFERHDNRHGVAATLDFLGIASFLAGDWPASTSYYDRAIGLLRDLGDRQRLSSSLATIVMSGGTIGRNVTAAVYRESAFWLQAAEEGLSTAREIGWAAGESYALINLSLTTGMRGDLGRALHNAQEGLEIAERIEHRLWTIFAHYTLGEIWVELMDVRRAAIEFEHAVAAARMSGAQMFITVTTAALADLLIDEGNGTQAAAMLRTVGPLMAPNPSLSRRECLFVQARIALACGEPDRAMEIIDRLDSASSPTAAGQGVPQLMSLRGEVLALLGQPDDAERAYREARDTAALFGYLPLLWRIETARGDLYRELGRTAEGDAAYHAAQTAIESIATSVDDENIREHFRQQAMSRLPAARRNGRVPATRSQLSTREMDVLRLLVEGQSDREIADELYISPRTVNRHVTSILNKFGVNTRTSAATAAIRQGIV